MTTFILEDDVADDIEQQDSATSQAKPWDELDLSNQLTPQPDSVDRLQPKVQQTIARTAPMVAQLFGARVAVFVAIVAVVTATGERREAVQECEGSHGWS